jgi:hypothetical protein
MTTMGLWPALLQAAQHHDLHQAADVQAGRRGVEADVGGDGAVRGRLVQFHGVADLVDIAARLERLQEVGFEGGLGHGGNLVACEPAL